MLRVIDVETTDKIGEGREPAVCEIGYTDVAVVGGEPQVGPTVSFLCNPGRPIELEAMATHHITPEMVEGLPPVDDVIAAHAIFTATGIEAFAAHSASFEQHFLKTPPGIPWLCTYKIAVNLAPNLMRHSNQYLRYALKLAVNPDRASPPHRAGPDTHVTAHLLARASRKLTLEQMVEISSRPLVLPRLTFGKHQGVPCAEIPLDYWDWVLKNITDNEDVRSTAEHYLNQPKRQRIAPAQETLGLGEQTPIDGAGP